MLQFGPFRLDTANECLWRGDEQIPLTPRPFAVLRYLVEHPSRLITHDELLDKLWPDTFVQPQVLRTYMLELRRILGDNAGEPQFIRTHAKRGYVFVAKVSERGDSPLHDAVLNGGATDLLGREKELRQLRALAQSAENAVRQIVFLSGESGIGKTALLDAFRRELAGSPAWICGRGQCVQGLHGREEYYPVMEALGQLCGSPRAEEIGRVLGKMAPAWLAALGQSPETGTTRPERAVAGICAALEELAKNGPVMLMFEDLHWADDATLQLLSALARRNAPAKLMVVATCAVSGKTPHQALRSLKQDLRLHRLATEITLGALSRTAIEALLSRELVKDELPGGLAAFVHQRSQGNPLFATAITEHLMAEQHLVRAGSGKDPRWELRSSFEEIESGVPAGLAQAVECEMERLSPAEQDILEAGSLMGISFPVWSVAAALDEDVSVTEEKCDGLARRVHFVEHAGTDELPDGSRSEFYVFVHHLYRDAIYTRQPATRRATRHARIADRLRAMFAGREECVARELARHYEAAGDRRRAAAALRHIERELPVDAAE
ncbi:MAG TPA: AAA family ATPase [Acidobacteriaceae bacterium]|nr:AAA family ATPase [Acidobacteriaceae bacterium]